MRLLILLGCACATLWAQDAAFEGTATNSVTGEALSGVHVTLFVPFTGEMPEKTWGAMSDKAGHFSIARIPAGNYAVMAQRAGFLYLPPKDSASPVSMVTLKAGEKRADFPLAMSPEAIVSGRVVDETGEPIPFAQVDLQPASPDTRPTMVRVMPAPGADDRGEFRLRSGPGKYFVHAQGPSAPGGGPTGGTYYPGVAEKGRAVVVEVQAGRETTGIEIRVTQQQAKTYSIAGTAVWAGDAITNVLIHIVGERTQSQQGIHNAKGGFLLYGLPPGEYRVFATADAGLGKLRSAPVEVHLAGADVTGVQLQLMPWGSMTGTIAIAGQSGGNTAQRSVTLQPVGDGFGGEGFTEAQSEGASGFRVETPLPQKYRVMVEPMPDHGYIQSTELDGAVNAGAEIDLRRASVNPRLKIVIGTDGAEVSGKLLDDEGKPLGPGFYSVVAILDGKEIDLRGSSGGASRDGSYKLAGLRPGRYHMCALNMFEFGGLPTEEELAKVVKASPVVEVKAGDRQTRDMKVTHAKK